MWQRSANKQVTEENNENNMLNIALNWAIFDTLFNILFIVIQIVQEGKEHKLIKFENVMIVIAIVLQIVSKVKNIKGAYICIALCHLINYSVLIFGPII